jgi:glycosyltransferase involved in cell wall biosynthesis
VTTDAPVVSVVIPAYNAEATLLAAVDSILQQSLRELELVVIDDGSTDRTAEILESVRDPRVRVITHSTCQGVVISLNEGVAAARSGTIARLDADDVAEPDRLALEHRLLDHDRRVGLVATAFRVIHSDGTEVRVGVPTDHATLRFELLFGNCILHSSVMFRRDVFDAVGGYRADCFPAEDYDLWLRLVEVTTAALIPSTQVTYHHTASGVSATRSSDQHDMALGLSSDAIARLVGRTPPRPVVAALTRHGPPLAGSEFPRAFELCLAARRAVQQDCRARDIPAGAMTNTLARVTLRAGIKDPAGHWRRQSLAWLAARHPLEAARLFSYRRAIG